MPNKSGVIQLPAVSSDVDAVISRTIDGLLHGYRLSPFALAELLGMSYPTLRRRLNGEGGKRARWTAIEIDVTARFFRVPVDDLFAGRVNLNPSPSDGGAGGVTVAYVSDWPDLSDLSGVSGQAA